MAGERARKPYRLPPPIRPLRSLRVKVLLVVSTVALAPLFFVGGWSLLERNIEVDMRSRVSLAADEVAHALADLDRTPEATADLRGRDELTRVIAESSAPTHGVRVRVFRMPRVATAESDADADFDQGTDPVHQLGTLFFGPDGAPTLDAFDRSLAPVIERAEIDEARTHGMSTACRQATGGKLLVCHGVRIAASNDASATIVYVQESSRRAVRALYDLRYQLARLSFATIPLAFLLAYWMGKRVVGPLEALRAQALARAATSGRPQHGDAATRLSVRGQDEITDLADAFDALLDTLAQRQGDNERFVADLVHEFKNPVAAVRAAADALVEGKHDEARARRLGRALQDSSARLDALVSQFLELARAEAGLPRDARVPVDIAALAAGLVATMRVSFEHVVFEVDAADDARVLGVPHGLDSALRNLLENAASFARPAGEKAPRVHVAVSSEGALVRVAVTDSGPGIAAEDLPRVFTRFFTTRGRARGTGLGLALVRATVEAHGGSVAVSSREGQGTTFDVRLPKLERAEKEAYSHQIHTATDDIFIAPQHAIHLGRAGSSS